MRRGFFVPSAFAYLIASCALVSACRGAGSFVWVQDLPPQPSSHGEFIRVGDTVSVRVFGQEAMSTKGRVTPEGTLDVPLLGRVVMAHQRPTDVAAALQERLKPFINAPSVTVTIEQSPISVGLLGEVKAPGVVALDDPPTLGQALARAGGLTQFADETRIFVVRSDGNGPVQRIRFTYDALTHGDPRSVRFELKAGDFVVVE